MLFEKVKIVPKKMARESEVSRSVGFYSHACAYFNTFIKKSQRKNRHVNLMMPRNPRWGETTSTRVPLCRSMFPVVVTLPSAFRHTGILYSPLACVK